MRNLIIVECSVITDISTHIFSTSKDLGEGSSTNGVSVSAPEEQAMPPVSPVLPPLPLILPSEAVALLIRSESLPPCLPQFRVELANYKSHLNIYNNNMQQLR